MTKHSENTQKATCDNAVLANRLFIYRGYEIKEFDYDYSIRQDNKWCAYNTNDCDEVLQISKTFDEMLDIIDHLFDCRF